MANSSTTVREGGTVTLFTVTIAGMPGSAWQCIGEIRKAVTATSFTTTVIAIAAQLRLHSQQLDAQLDS